METEYLYKASPLIMESTLLENIPELWDRNEVLLFLVDLEDYGTLGVEYLDDLEKEDLERLKTGHFRKRYIASRMALKCILCRILKETQVFGIATYKDEYGKVHVRNHEELHVCISYTENIAALAVSKIELGVDIEVIKKRSLSNIFKYLAMDTFQSGKPLNDPDILTIWTLKEAYCKFSNESIFSTFHRELYLDNVSYSSYIVDNKYILSIVTCKGQHAINLSHFQDIACP